MDINAWRKKLRNSKNEDKVIEEFLEELHINYYESGVYYDTDYDKYQDIMLNKLELI